MIRQSRIMYQLHLFSSICLDLFRIQRTIGTAVPAAAGLYIAGSSSPTSLLLMFFTAFFLHASTSALNDIADYDSDKINYPERLLVAGVISKRQTSVLAVTMLFAGLFLALILDWLLFLTAATAGLLLMISYNFGLKLKDRPIGSVAYLSLSTSTIPFLGGFIVMRNLNVTAFFLTLAVALLTSSAVIGSLKDIKGDARAKKRTIAVILGETKARKVALILLLAPIAWYPVLQLIFGFSQMYLVYALIPISIRLIISATLLRPRTDKILTQEISSRLNQKRINIPRNLMRLLIAVDFLVLALGRPETGLPWL